MQFENYFRLNKEKETIESLDDFIVHTEKHRSRVFFIGLEIYERFKDFFSKVDYKQLKQFLLLHDQGKVLVIQDQYIFGKTLYSKAFGHNINELDRLEKIEAKRIVSLINEYDTQIALEFFENNNLLLNNGELTQAARLMKRIELLADHIDRGMCPKTEQEFGREMKKASSYLNKQFDREIAESIESDYQNIIN